MMDGRLKRLVRAVSALSATMGVLVFAGSAFANAPNPIPGTAKVDSVSVSKSGAYTITVEGQWNWVTQTSCPTARDGVGYNVAWFDPSDTANPIGGNNSPNGVIDVGTATDNIVHSIYTNGGPSNTLVTSANPFYDGVPTSYLSHNTTDSTPTKTDAKNWVSNCSNVDPATKISSGQWGPISHTYPAGFNGPFVFCPVMYDPHGKGTANGGVLGTSSVGDLTAGGQGHNNDNSYEGNGQGANGNNCQQLTIPTISTKAEANAALGSPISDRATLKGSSPTGTITWNVYKASDANCSRPLNSQPSTLTTSVNGNGDYRSPTYTPTATGSYQWVATYSGDSSNASVSTNCNDPAEVSVVSQNPPGIKVVKLDSVPCADLAPSVSQPADASCAGTVTNFTHGIVTLQVPRSGSYSIPVDYQIQVTDTGQTTLDLPTAGQLDDPMCDPGTVVGPTANGGTLGFSSRTGQDTVLSVGGEALYTCTHTLTQNDASSGVNDAFTNTVSVTAYPPSGPPVHGSDLVTVHRVPPPPPQPFCIARKGKHKGHKVDWPKGTPKPAVCKPPHHHHHPRPKRPKRPSGFTG